MMKEYKKQEFIKHLKIFLVAVYLLFGTTCFASDIKVDINGKNIEFDVAPVIQNGRTLVPMRKIFEELGCDVEWLGESKMVIATKNSKIIALQIDNNIVIVNDIDTGKVITVQSDTAPVIYNDRTMIPVRVISECLGYSVNWNGEEQTVLITTEQFDFES